MGLLAVVNPSRRRRRRKSKARRGHRKMTAKQLRYFGPRRKRVHRRRRSPAVFANPIGNPRRRRRSRGRSRYRRNPASLAARGAPRFRMGYISSAVQDAAIGAGGALAVDFTMAQAARALPATLTSRMNAEGGLNLGYYGTKLGIAIGLGVLSTQFLPGRFRGMAAKAVAGSLTVQAYEVLRGMLPANVVLGYFTPAPVVSGNRLSAYMNTRRIAAPGSRVGAYFRTGTGAPAIATDEARIGEGAIS